MAQEYDTFLVRVKKGSLLAAHVAAQRENGMSLNSLINKLLALHYGVPCPLKWSYIRKTEVIGKGV